MRYVLDYLSRALSWSVLLPQPNATPQRASPTDSNDLVLPRHIPGGSPLNYCNESSKADLYQVEQIELYPNPLRIDDVFEVHAYGTFLKNITDNATFTSMARYENYSEPEYGTLNFCDTVDSIEQPGGPRKHDCPPQKGFALIMMSYWVQPMYIVPGHFYFKFDAVTQEGERIYCFETNIYFDYRDKRDRASAWFIEWFSKRKTYVRRNGGKSYRKLIG